METWGRQEAARGYEFSFRSRRWTYASLSTINKMKRAFLTLNASFFLVQRIECSGMLYIQESISIRRSTRFPSGSCQWLPAINHLSTHEISHAVCNQVSVTYILMYACIEQSLKSRLTPTSKALTSSAVQPINLVSTFILIPSRPLSISSWK